MSRDRRDPNRISLLIRNLPLDATADDVKAKFERFGEIRDVYLPKDYYTNRARGFGFIEFRDPRDAEDALCRLDRTVFMGREISVVMSRESRKTPRDMIQRERATGSGGSSRGYDRDRDYRDRDYRDRDRDRGGRYRDRSRSPRRHSRSRSPRERSSRRGGSRSRSRSPPPRRDSYRRRSPSRSRSPAPRRQDSPPARRYDDDEVPRHSPGYADDHRDNRRDDYVEEPRRSRSADGYDDANGRLSPDRGYDNGNGSPPRSPGGYGNGGAADSPGGSQGGGYADDDEVLDHGQ